MKCACYLVGLDKITFQVSKTSKESLHVAHIEGNADAQRIELSKCTLKMEMKFVAEVSKKVA